MCVEVRETVSVEEREINLTELGMKVTFALASRGQRMKISSLFCCSKKMAVTKMAFNMKIVNT